MARDFSEQTNNSDDGALLFALHEVEVKFEYTI